MGKEPENIRLKSESVVEHRVTLKIDVARLRRLLKRESEEPKKINVKVAGGNGNGNGTGNH